MCACVCVYGPNYERTARAGVGRPVADVYLTSEQVFMPLARYLALL